MTRSAPVGSGWNRNVTALLVIASTLWFADSFLFIWTQSADNPLGQDLVDVAMPWHWFRAARGRVIINVVLAPVSEQRAPHLLQSLHQVKSLHATSNSSTFLIPGICSELNVWNKSRKCSLRSSRS